MNKKLLIILIIIFLYTTLIYSKNKKEKILMNSLKHMWAKDTCESLEFRFSFFISLRDDNYNPNIDNPHLRVFKQKDIEYICGKPYNIDTINNNIVLRYFSYNPDYLCGCDTKIQLFYMRYDFHFNRRKKLIDVQSGFMIE
jgi:hypothetical protein